LSITFQNIVEAALALLVLATLMLAWSLYRRIARLAERSGAAVDLTGSSLQIATPSGHQPNDADALLDAFAVLESTLSHAMSVISDSEMRLAMAASGNLRMSDCRPLNDSEHKVLSTQPQNSSVSAGWDVDSPGEWVRELNGAQTPKSCENRFERQPRLSNFSVAPSVRGESKSAYVYDISTGLRLEREIVNSHHPVNGDSAPEISIYDSEQKKVWSGQRLSSLIKDSEVSASEKRSFVEGDSSENEAAAAALFSAADRTAQLLRRIDSTQSALKQFNLTVSKINNETIFSSADAFAPMDELQKHIPNVSTDCPVTPETGGAQVASVAIGKLSHIAAKLTQLASRFSL
jgi:hypothetical protein